jgi:hypothetical protein
VREGAATRAGADDDDVVALGHLRVLDSIPTTRGCCA